MSNLEIEKALEICSQENHTCDGCPYQEDFYCIWDISSDTLDYINRLKEKIVKLENLIKKSRGE